MNVQYLELFNCILYITTLYTYWKKYNRIDCYFVLIFAYTFTSIMCFFARSYGMIGSDISGTLKRDTTLIPYLYLYICILICFSPLKSLSIDNSSFGVKNTFPIKLLTWVYIIAGIGSVIYSYPKVMEIVQGGEYALVRQALYADDGTAMTYSSQAERILKNIQNVLNPFGIIMCFYYLTNKKSMIIIALLFTAWIGREFVDSALTASRGMIANLLLKLLLIFVFFKQAFDEKIRRLFVLSSIVLSIPLFIYMIAVSISRFDDDASSSIFYYLGHSMSTFNANVMGTMHDFAGGKLMFREILDQLGLDSRINSSALGMTHGTGFYTYIGTFYIDFGPVGTLFMCFLINRLLWHFVKKRQFMFSDMVIILYAITFFMNGVFVIGGGYAWTWLMIFLLYFLLRMIETKNNI